MKLDRFTELSNYLTTEQPADADIELFVAKDGHSVDLRQLELVVMCQVPETNRWQRCEREAEPCTRTQQLGILLS